MPPDRQPHGRFWAERASTGINIGLMNRLVGAATITAGWRIERLTPDTSNALEIWT